MFVIDRRARALLFGSTCPALILGAVIFLIDTDASDSPARSELEAALAELQPHLQQVGNDQFAGVYLDDRGPETMVVVALTEPEAHGPGLRAQFRYPTSLEVVHARHSMRDRRAAQKALEDMPRAERDELGVHGFAIDVRRNGLEVLVDRASEAVRERLQAEVGAVPIRIVEEARPELLTPG